MSFDIPFAIGKHLEKNVLQCNPDWFCLGPQGGLSKQDHKLPRQSPTAFKQTLFQVPGKEFFIVLGSSPDLIKKDHQPFAEGLKWGLNGQSMPRKDFNQFLRGEPKFLYFFNDLFPFLVLMCSVQVHYLHCSIFTSAIQFPHISFSGGQT